MAIKALAFNSTLKSSSSSEASSTGKLLDLISKEFDKHGVETEIVRLADHDIKPGVTSDEGEGDAWPEIREKVLSADILLIGTPIWLGQPSSVCKRALERMDALLEETDEQGRMVSYGKVAAVAIVGNEDGAHHVSAEVYQALNDVGFTIPANAVAYLGRRSDGIDQLRRRQENAGGSRDDDLHVGTQYRPSRRSAQRFAVPRRGGVMTPAPAASRIPPASVQPHAEARRLSALRQESESCAVRPL